MIDELVFVVYLVVLALVGFLTSRRSSSFEGYAIADRSMRFWLLFFTTAATWIGGGITMGIAGKAFAGDAVSVWATILGLGGTLFIAGFFYARPLRRMSLTTLSDFFDVRYGKSAGTLSSIVFIAAYTFSTTAQLTAGATLIQSFFSWDYALCALIIGTVIIAYTVMGGLWAVAITDAIQFFILLLGVVMAIVTSVRCFGGELMSAAGPVLNTEFAGTMDFWALLIVFALGDIPAPDLMQRFFAAESDKAASRSAVMSGFAYMILGIVSVFIGCAAALLFVELPNPDLAFPGLLQRLLPPGLTGIALAGLLAAVMSNADSMLLAPSTIAAKNLLRSKNTLLTSRLSVVCIGAASMLIAVLRQDVIYWLALAWDTLLAGLFFPLTLGLFSRRISRRGALLGIVGGIAARIVLEIPASLGFIPPWGASLGAPVISLVLALL